jgi:hypothetical protein
MPKNHPALMALAMTASLVSTVLAADDTLTLTFTTTAAGGHYSPRNVHAMYLTDVADKFVTTVGNGTGAKRALWGNSRAHDIQQWFAANPKPQPDIDARTGATETAYRTYTISWNWTQRDGSLVPDGTYKLKFEMTDDNATSNKFHRAEFPVTKGRTAWKIGPVTQGGYKDVVIQYAPAPSARLVCEPNAIDFGTQAVGLTAERTFNLLNTGTAAATVTALEVTGQDKAAYSLIPAAGLPLALAAGGTSAVVVRFAPDSGRDYSQAQIQVTASGLTVPPVLLKASGEVLAGAIALSADTLDLGQVRPGDSKVAVISVGNTGQGPLHVQSLTLTGLDADQFSLPAGLQGGLPAILPGQGPVEIAIGFSPKAYKACHATLAIASDDPNRPVAEVALEGEGGPLAPGSLSVLYGLGGRCRAIAMYGDEAVIGEGMVLSVYGVADRDGPWFVSSTVLAGNIERVTIVGDAGFAALGEAGLAIVRVEEVNAPTVLSNVRTAGFCHGATLVGTRLCIAEGPAGLSIYDVSSLSQPIRLGSLQGDIVAVAGLGTRAVCLDRRLGLIVVDVAQAVALGAETQLLLGESIVTSGSTAYVADGQAGFFVVDLANPASPQIVGRAQLAGPAVALIVKGFTVAAAVGAAGMQLIDVSDPVQPRPCTPIGLVGECTDLAVNNLGVYAVDRQFGLYDFKLPTGCQIVRRRQFSAGMNALDVAVGQNAAYVAGGAFGLSVWNMADIVPPRFMGHVEGDVQAVAVSGTRACLACGEAGLKVVDVSSAVMPTELGSLAVGGYADKVAAEGTLAMIGTGEFVTIVDVSDPCRPLARAAWRSQAPVLGLALSQGLGFVACGSQGLVVLNADGTVLSALDTPGVAHGVAMSGSIAYVADGPAGIQVVDLHDPRAPLGLATFAAPGPVYAAVASGNDLYVAGSFGLWRLDVTVPGSAVLRAASAIPSHGVSLAVLAPAVLVADPEAGVLILQRDP